MPWVIHGFRGKATEAAQLLDQGLYLSFGRYYHPESLTLAHRAGAAFLETDEAPLPIEDIYTEAASTLGLPLPELRHQLYERCQRLLALPPSSTRSEPRGHAIAGRTSVASVLTSLPTQHSSAPASAMDAGALCFLA